MQKESPTGERTALKPVHFRNVTVGGPFWGPRVASNATATIAAQYEQLKKTGRLDAFRLNWKPGMQPVPHRFWDSDVAKWIEAASYTLAVRPDAVLVKTLDEVVDLVISAQQPDGYLNIYYTVVEPDKRWRDLLWGYELYCAGHLMEAAVAHAEATGQRKLLDALCRYADLICATFGRGAGQIRGYCNHPEIELALVKLYRATGERRYLDLAYYFVDERGQQPNYFDSETIALSGQNDIFNHYFTQSGRKYSHEFNLSHKPIREQERVTGHAVRATYLYSAMVDLALETGDTTLWDACQRFWKHMTGALMYVTGGIGPSRLNEGFTTDYDLPNDTAYCETCAAIGLVLWNHRLVQLDLDARYVDVMERALYNGTISGVSLDGMRFFYVNPLESQGNHHRQEWFPVACCPPNLARLIGQLGGLIYSEGEDVAVVHLYVEGDGTLQIGGRQVILRQETDYPWDGRVRITLEPETPMHFALKLRIPGWCRRASIRVCGQPTPLVTEKGYAVLAREWQPDDIVELELSMPIERVYAHPNVRADVGRVALQRGPIVYCLEGADNGPGLNALTLPRDIRLEPKWEPDLLGGVVSITGGALKVAESGPTLPLYQSMPHEVTPVTVKAIPYCTWDNRAPGEMLVWIREM